jgi:PadR family transcriptional regulator PadR
MHRQLSPPLLHSHILDAIPMAIQEVTKVMGDKADVWQGTLALMVLTTLETMGPLHGYGIARRIEQTSGNLLSLNYGTLYPALLKLEQEGAITSEWGVSDTNRKAKFYKLTRAGRRQLERETQDWEQTTAILARFLSPAEEA